MDAKQEKAARAKIDKAFAAIEAAAAKVEKVADAEIKSRAAMNATADKVLSLEKHLPKE